MSEIHEYLTKDYDGFSICSIDVTCDNHLISFAAEKSRVEHGSAVDFKKYKESFSI